MIEAALPPGPIDTSTAVSSGDTRRIDGESGTTNGR